MMKKTDGPASKNLKLSGAKFQSVKRFKFGAMERDNNFKFGAQKLQVF